MATEKQQITTYNGKNIFFYPNSHRYKLENEKGYLLSPSAITGILDKSQALLIWNDKLIKDFYSKIEENKYSTWEVQKLFEEALEIRKIKVEEAQDIGSIVHDYAENTAYAKAYGLSLPEIPENIPEQAMVGIQAFLKFEIEKNVKYLEAEKFIYSEKNYTAYVGRFDAIIEIDGVRILTDYKTSKGVYTSQKYQLAGYDLALIEEYEFKGEKLPYEKIGVLHFDKNTGEPTLHILSDEERKLAQEAFKALLTVKSIEKSLNVWEKKKDEE